ncbi:ABC transporter permease [Anaerotruncus rubiinfantis]|uniref:ABC transporter permease n=1 Tax=Anaerotruncus rubiinfantis TaxID=1720200 RepID=UPI0034A4FAE3
MLNLRENIQLAVNGLRSNKMRALLTMLGIIIGISSVITIVTVGDSMTASVTSVFADMGANSFQLRITDKPDENGNTNWNRQYEKEDYISDEMLAIYNEQFGDEIDVWGATVNVGPGQVQVGRKQEDINMLGINANALGIQNIEIVAGHDISEREVSGDKQVAVISEKMAEKLFPGVPQQQALGQEIKVRASQGLYTFTIVGLYHYEVTGMMAGMVGDTNNLVIVPTGVAKQIALDGGASDTIENYYGIQVKAKPGVDVEDFAQRSEAFFNKAFYRGNKYVEAFAENMDSMIGSMTSMMDTMKLAISVIAAISLLVGGIGVMNIMLVSVTERTREIGTRKALGAKNSAIRVQFIVESMIICLIGGAIGVLLGTTLGRLGSVALGAPGWPSLSIVLVAVAFSMGIGVFFGYYPANKAAKLDPIEALRYE